MARKGRQGPAAWSAASPVGKQACPAFSQPHRPLRRPRSLGCALAHRRSCAAARRRSAAGCVASRTRPRLLRDTRRPHRGLRSACQVRRSRARRARHRRSRAPGHRHRCPPEPAPHSAPDRHGGRRRRGTDAVRTPRSGGTRTTGGGRHRPGRCGRRCGTRPFTWSDRNDPGQLGTRWRRSGIGPSRGQNTQQCEQNQRSAERRPNPNAEPGPIRGGHPGKTTPRAATALPGRRHRSRHQPPRGPERSESRSLGAASRASRRLPPPAAVARGIRRPDRAAVR